MGKRHRASLSAGMKKELCQYKIDHPAAKLSDLIEIFSKRWDTSVGRTTISDILREQDKWLSVSEHFEGIRRVVGAKYEQLEESLFKQFVEARNRNEAVNDEWLFENAKRIGKQMNVGDFRYSTGWLCGFKKRYVIGKSDLPGQHTLICKGEFSMEKAQFSLRGRPRLAPARKKLCKLQSDYISLLASDGVTLNSMERRRVTLQEAKEALIKVITFFSTVTVNEDYLCVLFTLLKYLSACCVSHKEVDVKCEASAMVTPENNADLSGYINTDDKERACNLIDIKEECLSSDEQNGDDINHSHGDVFTNGNCSVHVNDKMADLLFVEEPVIADVKPSEMFTKRMKRVRKEDSFGKYVKLVNENLRYECDICGKTFLLYQRCRRHVKLVHSGERPFKCLVCGKTFPENATLKKHTRVHTGEKPHLCMICGKKLSTQSGLVIHIRSHTGEKPFTCPQCNKSFSQSSGLTEHRRVHSSDKPFSCDFCGKTFKRGVELRVHRRVHTGEHPYKCGICDKAFMKWNCWRSHMRRHTGERPFSCMVCDKAFAQKALLTNHVRVHTGEKPFSCAICGKRFSQNGSLYHHKKMHKSRTT